MKPIKLYANETENTVWLTDERGASVGGRKVVSVQIVGPIAWATAVYQVVGRLAPVCAAVALPGIKPLTAAQPFAFQFDVTGIPEVGLKLTTAEGSTLELDAYVFVGA